MSSFSAESRSGWLAAMALLVVVLASGCERRAFYRRQADRDVDIIVQQSTRDPRYALPGVDVTMDPRSRYYDPYNPDRPPMPSDDPASHRYMHLVNGMRGYRGWEDNGIRGELENPSWRMRLGEYVPMNERGAIILNVDSALRLAYVHSPTYQNQLETLYLTALDVTTERFRLQTQFFGGNDLTYAHNGNLTPGGERSTLSNAPALSTNRRFATAGELVVGFANSIVWQFAGNDTNSHLSIVNFSLVQPLLRTGGRVIALEQLTIVERAMLANLRAFHRYRQGFYTQIAIGNLGVSGPSRRGGFFGGTGLTGFTGTGTGGVGGVAGTGGGNFGGFGGGGTGTAGGLAGGGAGSVGGFIGLLQSLQEYRNSQDNFELQLRSLQQLESLLEAERIDLIQVDQFRQSIETQRAQLLQSGIALENSIENYLTGTLGLPPDLPVQLDDSFIRQFQLIAPEMTAIQAELGRLQDQIEALPEPPTPEMLTPFPPRLAAEYDRMLNFVEVIRSELDALDASAEAQRGSMDEAGRREFEATLAEVHVKFDEALVALDPLSEKLAVLQSEFDPSDAEGSISSMVVLVRAMQDSATELSLAQARVRVASVELDTVQIDLDTARLIMRANRPDLMNNRASLVDTWRLIAFNANALRSDVDIRFSGNLGTTGNNMAKFQAPTGNMTAGLEFDAPFTRLLERNNYRQALIDYQRSRRQYIQFEDSMNQSLRQLLRQLEQLRVNMQIQRRAVAISIRRVDLTRLELNRPVAPPQPGAASFDNNQTLVQNLLSALNDLRNTQNNFMSVWLNYYAARMVLMRDLGIMELDDQGRWVDQPVDFMLYLPTEPIELPPGLPQEWLDEAFPEGFEPEEIEPGSDEYLEGIDLVPPMEDEDAALRRGLVPLTTVPPRPAPPSDAGTEPMGPSPPEFQATRSGPSTTSDGSEPSDGTQRYARRPTRPGELPERYRY